jgi:actin-related protein
VDEEKPNIAYGFLQTVRQLHRMEVAQKLLSNIVITGGLSFVLNFVGRLSEELQYFLGNDFQDLKELGKVMKITVNAN